MYRWRSHLAKPALVLNFFAPRDANVHRNWEFWGFMFLSGKTVKMGMDMVQFGNGNCYMGMGIKNIFSHTSKSRLSNKYNAHTMGIPWIWEWTWCNLGSGMGTGIAIWEWVGTGIRNSFPQTSASRPLLSEMKKRSAERGTQRIWLLHAVEHSLALGELAVAELRASGRPAGRCTRSPTCKTLTIRHH